MPPYNATTLRLALRYRTGMFDPAAPTDETGMSNAELDSFLDEARREVNLKAQAWQFGSFNTVAAQQRYSPAAVAWPATKIGTAQVFWGLGAAGADCDCSAFSSYTGMAGAIGNALALGQPLVPFFDQIAADLNARYFSLIAFYFGGRGWEERDGYVWLDPVPVDVRAVYYLVPVERFAAAADVDAEYASALIDWATHLSCSAQSLKGAELTHVNDGAMIEAWNSPDAMRRVARDAQKKWDNRFATLPEMRAF